jgi:hypothetical protein
MDASTKPAVVIPGSATRPRNDTVSIPDMKMAGLGPAMTFVHSAEVYRSAFSPCAERIRNFWVIGSIMS